MEPRKQESAPLTQKSDLSTDRGLVTPEEAPQPFHREPETGNGSSHPADVTGGCARRRRGLPAETEAEAAPPAFLCDGAQFEQSNHSFY